MNKLLKIFIIFLRIGAFTFGGGYAMIPLIQNEIVEKNNWIEREEFLDIIALSQSIPGPLAVNCSTYIGYRILGLKGAVVACLGAVLPSFFIILIIARYLITSVDKVLLDKIFDGIRPAVVSLILIAVYRLKKAIRRNNFNYIIMFSVFFLISFLRINPIFIIIISGILGLLVYKGVKLDGSNN